MLAFCGFNGFGQFGGDHKRKVTLVKEFEIADCRLCKELPVLVSTAWSYNAFAVGNKLWLKGFLQNKPATSLEILVSDPIQQLAASDKYCLVLLQTGKLWKICPKTDQKLQEVKFASTETESDLPRAALKRSIFGEPRSNSAEVQFRVTHIACGAHIACAVSNTNAVYNIPSKIHQLGQHLHVQQLVCGFEHAMLLTSNGDIYSWGNGLRGQLGQDVMGATEYPQLIEALAGVKIVYIAAGGWHSAAISAFGDLYTWGFNPNGQLGLRVYNAVNGLKCPTVYPLPQVIDLPICCDALQEDSKESGTDFQLIGEECTPRQVFTGARHTIVKMSCGVLFATGWNAHGQLGLDSDRDFYDQFCHLPAMAIERNIGANFSNNVDVICAAWCTIFKEF